MEKPTLKDFNLTEQDFVILEEQKKKYENALADHAKYKKRVEDENSSTFKISNNQNAAYITEYISLLQSFI